MASEPLDVRRADIGDGVYVAMPADDGREESPARWHVPAAALPLAAALALAAALRLGATTHAVMAAAVLAVLGVIAAIDFKWRVVPNKIVGPATLAVLAWQLAFAPNHIAAWIAAAVGAPLFLLVAALVSRKGLGMGDVKLAGLLGAALGAAVMPALLVAFLACVPVALALLIRGGVAARRTAIPFAPFMCFGAAVMLLA